MLVVISLSWVTALLAAPAAASHAPASSAVVYAAGAMVCHQRPERSFHYHGSQLPVCARCLGLYVGGLAGVLLWAGVSGLDRRPSRRAERLIRARHVRTALVIVALPTLLSAATAWLGWWDAPNTLRALIAIPLGAAIGAIVCAAAARDLR